MMLFSRILHRFKPKRIDDPAFGPLVYRHGVWHGILDAAGKVSVQVFAGETEPTQRHRDLFTELKRRLAELTSVVEGPLSNEYRQCRDVEEKDYETTNPNWVELFEADFPAIRESRDIWFIARLGCVQVQGDEHGDVCLNYDMNWGDPDHWLSVLLKDWQVIDVGKDG